MTTSKGNKHTESSDPHWIEWVTGAICTLLGVASFTVSDRGLRHGLVYELFTK